MAGSKPASQDKKGITPGKRKARVALLVSTWALVGLWLETPEAHASPNFALISSGFGFLSVWAFGVAARSVIRWASGPSKTGAVGSKADHDGLVTQCLPVPRGSPSTQRIVRELPPRTAWRCSPIPNNP